MFLEFLQVYLPIIIYILLIVFLSVGIVLAFKLMGTISKVDKVVDSVSTKVESLNGLFRIIDFVTDRITGITDKVVDKIEAIIKKMFSKKKKNKIEEKEEEI